MRQVSIVDAAPWLVDAWDWTLTKREKEFILKAAMVRTVDANSPFSDFELAQQIAIFDAIQRVVDWGSKLSTMLRGAERGFLQSTGETPQDSPLIDAYRNMQKPALSVIVNDR